MAPVITTVDQAYEHLLANWTDMQDHLPTLRKYAKGNCMEIGVRNGASTTALLRGLEDNGGHLWSFDINDCQVYVGHPQWTFTQADSIGEKQLILDITPKEIDVLFVDGDHSYEGALSDLQTYGPRAKVILVHDCDCPITFPGVRRAFEEYAASIGKPAIVLPGSYGLGVIDMSEPAVQEVPKKRWFSREPAAPETPKEVDISQAVKIDGWMTEPELHWLAEQASTRKSIVEMGAYLGRTTRALGDNAAGEVYAYDDWEGLRENWWVIDTPAEVKKTLWTVFCVNLHDLIHAGKVIPVRENHANLHLLPNRPMVDMLFIDGDHSFESVKRDIELWRPFLLPGALVCGHDINQMSVEMASRECLGEVKTVVGLIWAWWAE